jgi:hypothetical protein
MTSTEDSRIGLSPTTVRRLMVKMIPKSSCGRRGLPDYAVNAMYSDYQSGLSTHALAGLYGRTAQSIWEMFRKRGLLMRSKKGGPKILFNGKTFCPGKGGVFRCTTDKRDLLHHRIWEAHNGAIPKGFQVSFKDGDHSNISLTNLFCARPADVTLFHYRRRFPDRAELTPGQRRAMWRTYNRLLKRRKAVIWKKRGLRSDGKPLARRSRAQGGNAAWRRLSDCEPNSGLRTSPHTGL